MRMIKSITKKCIYTALQIVRKMESIFKQSPRVVFYSPASFQARHLYPVVQYMIEHTPWEIFLIGDFDNKFNCANFTRLRYFPLYKNIDIYISTELISPWWFDGKKIFFGHGIGPKMEYQERYNSSDFDVSFSPCMPAYNAHSDSEHSGKESYKIGLPVLDLYINKKVKLKKEEICDLLGIDVNKPILVYAPSWNYRSDLNSDFGLIIGRLKKCDCFTLVVSPHPNLLDGEKSNVAHHFFQEGVVCNSMVCTLDVCAVADVVISDISSVMYESIALKKLVVFDGNKKAYVEYGAIKVLHLVNEFIPSIDWMGDVCAQIDQIMRLGQIDQGDKFRDKYFFNLGVSTEVFVRTVDSILHEQG